VIHLSVALGRFFEALFYAILRVAGVIAMSVIAIALLGGAAFLVARLLLARGRR
jgi:hypothetical protein